MQWIDDHADEFKKPVMNKQFYKEADDVIVFVSLGPNTRNDYHVNPTEELFYQLKGDIAVRIRPLDGTPPHDVIIREGEMYLHPAKVELKNRPTLSIITGTNRHPTDLLASTEELTDYLFVQPSVNIEVASPRFYHSQRRSHPGHIY